MIRPVIIYYEQVEIIACHDDPQQHECLKYEADLQIQDSGDLPVVLKMKRISSPSSSKPKPPPQYIIGAKNIMDLYAKLQSWFKDYGYVLNHI